MAERDKTQREKNRFLTSSRKIQTICQRELIQKLKSQMNFKGFLILQAMKNQYSSSNKIKHQANEKDQAVKKVAATQNLWVLWAIIILKITIQILELWLKLNLIGSSQRLLDRLVWVCWWEKRTRSKASSRYRIIKNIYQKFKKF